MKKFKIGFEKVVHIIEAESREEAEEDFYGRLTDHWNTPEIFEELSVEHDVHAQKEKKK